MDSNKNDHRNKQKDEASEGKTNMDLDNTPGRVENPKIKNDGFENDDVSDKKENENLDQQNASSSKEKTNEDFNKQKPDPTDPNQTKSNP